MEIVHGRSSSSISFWMVFAKVCSSCRLSAGPAARGVAVGSCCSPTVLAELPSGAAGVNLASAACCKCCRLLGSPAFCSGVAAGCCCSCSCSMVSVNLPDAVEVVAVASALGSCALLLPWPLPPLGQILPGCKGRRWVGARAACERHVSYTNMTLPTNLRVEVIDGTVIIQNTSKSWMSKTIVYEQTQ